LVKVRSSTPTSIGVGRTHLQLATMNGKCRCLRRRQHQRTDNSLVPALAAPFLPQMLPDMLQPMILGYHVRSEVLTPQQSLQRGSHHATTPMSHLWGSVYRHRTKLPEHARLLPPLTPSFYQALKRRPWLPGYSRRSVRTKGLQYVLCGMAGLLVPLYDMHGLSTVLSSYSGRTIRDITRHPYLSPRYGPDEDK